MKHALDGASNEVAIDFAKFIQISSRSFNMTATHFLRAIEASARHLQEEEAILADAFLTE